MLVVETLQGNKSSEKQLVMREYNSIVNSTLILNFNHYHQVINKNEKLTHQFTSRNNH
jgi:hypothetical protein